MDKSCTKNESTPPKLHKNILFQNAAFELEVISYFTYINRKKKSFFKFSMLVICEILLHYRYVHTFTLFTRTFTHKSTHVNIIKNFKNRKHGRFRLLLHLNVELKSIANKVISKCRIEKIEVILSKGKFEQKSHDMYVTNS